MPFCSVLKHGLANTHPHPKHQNTTPDPPHPTTPPPHPKCPPPPPPPQSTPPPPPFDPLPPHLQDNFAHPNQDWGPVINDPRWIQSLICLFLEPNFSDAEFPRFVVRSHSVELSVGMRQASVLSHGKLTSGLEQAGAQCPYFDA